MRRVVERRRFATRKRPCCCPAAVLLRLFLGETVLFDLADVQLSARKGLIAVRPGKGETGRNRGVTG